MASPQYPNQPQQLPQAPPQQPPNYTYTNQPTPFIPQAPPQQPNIPNGQTFSYSRVSARVICQFCNQQTDTSIEHKNGLMVWLGCGGAVCVGCWLGCCLIPFCIDDLKDCYHICGNCGKVVGISKLA